MSKWNFMYVLKSVLNERLWLATKRHLLFKNTYFLSDEVIFHLSKRECDKHIKVKTPKSTSFWIAVTSSKYDWSPNGMDVFVLQVRCSKISGKWIISIKSGIKWATTPSKERHKNCEIKNEWIQTKNNVVIVNMDQMERMERLCY